MWQYLLAKEEVEANLSELKYRDWQQTGNVADTLAKAKQLLHKEQMLGPLDYWSDDPDPDPARFRRLLSQQEGLPQLPYEKSTKGKYNTFYNRYGSDWERWYMKGSPSQIEPYPGMPLLDEMRSWSPERRQQMLDKLAPIIPGLVKTDSPARETAQRSTIGRKLAMKAAKFLLDKA